MIDASDRARDQSLVGVCERATFLQSSVGRLGECLTPRFVLYLKFHITINQQIILVSIRRGTRSFEPSVARLLKINERYDLDRTGDLFRIEEFFNLLYGVIC